MSDVDRCVSFAREFGVPDAKARELCRDRELQRCAAFWRPSPGAAGSRDVQLRNLEGCYGRSTTEGRT